jgi:hypothetical protein
MTVRVMRNGRGVVLCFALSSRGGGGVAGVVLMYIVVNSRLRVFVDKM